MESVHLYFQDIFWRCQYHTELFVLLSGFAMVHSHSRPREPHLAPNKGLEGGCLAAFSNLCFPPPPPLAESPRYELRSASNSSESRL